MKSLRDGAEREGGKVIAFLERHREQGLSTPPFDPGGRPELGAPLLGEVESVKPSTLSAKTVTEARAAVAQARRRRGLTEALMEAVKQQRHDADDAQGNDTVTSAVDELGVKAQKAARVHQGGASATPAAQTKAVAGDECPEPPVPAANQRPTVHPTGAQLERLGRRLTLTGAGVGQVLRFVLAFLLTKGLLAPRLRLFTDGQRSLQGAILTFFRGPPAASLILDGFHGVKKFKEPLSLACRGRELRHRHPQVLLGL